MMKVFRKFLYVLIILMALLCILIIVCAVRPDVTDKIKEILYKEDDQAVSAEISAQPESDSVPGEMSAEIDSDMMESIVYLPGDSGIGAANTAEGSGNAGRNPESRKTAESVNGDGVSEYIAPDESAIVIPDSVSGKSGYKQIQDDARQVDDVAAGDIESRLDVGYTGDGMDFDAVYYPYYAMLNDKEKHIYRQIYANANGLYPVFMPVEEVTSSGLRDIFAAVYNDHPELFWLETAYVCKYKRSGQCVEIDLEFNRTAEELESAKVEFDAQVNAIVSQVQNLPDQYTREKAVHDALIERISYHADAEMNQSAYSALVNGETVCAGYSRAFQYILQQLGIPCYYCTGYAGESHAWNIVALEDGYYNVDTTWDDTDGGNYNYFNKSDEDYANSHIRQEMSVYLPPCNGQMYRIAPEEQDMARDELRSLGETGLSEEQVFTDMNAYYADCYRQITSNGKGHYTFTNAVRGEQLFEEWKRNYDSEDYRQAYMENAMTAAGAYHCTMALGVEKLQDDIYLVTHEVMLSD